MKIPKKLKIGGHTIKIVFKELEGENGSFDSSKNTIFINPNIPRSQQESTLFHEILHALNSTMDSHDYGHAFLDSFAEQLYQVFSVNKLLKDE